MTAVFPLIICGCLATALHILCIAEDSKTSQTVPKLVLEDKLLQIHINEGTKWPNQKREGLHNDQTHHQSKTLTALLQLCEHQQHSGWFQVKRKNKRCEKTFPKQIWNWTKSELRSLKQKPTTTLIQSIQIQFPNMLVSMSAGCALYPVCHTCHFLPFHKVLVGFVFCLCATQREKKQEKEDVMWPDVICVSNWRFVN